jgi:hypothetical protein
MWRCRNSQQSSGIDIITRTVLTFTVYKNVSQYHSPLPKPRQLKHTYSPCAGIHLNSSFSKYAGCKWSHTRLSHFSVICSIGVARYEDVYIHSLCMPRRFVTRSLHNNALGSSTSPSLLNINPILQLRTTETKLSSLLEASVDMYCLLGLPSSLQSLFKKSTTSCPIRFVIFVYMSSSTPAPFSFNESSGPRHRVMTLW